MLARLEVSRPTFRQAVKMVAKEQLIRTRRGVHGGLYATRPDASAVAHVAAIYLHTRNATQEHLIRAYPPTYVEAARMAARNKDPALRKRLAEFDAEEPTESELTVRDFFLRDREFTQILFAMTENPVMQLMAEIIYDFSLSFLPKGIFSARPERARDYVRIRRKLSAAIVGGEETVAVVYADQCQQEALRWLHEDMVNTTKRLGFEPRQDVADAAARKPAASRRKRPNS